MFKAPDQSLRTNSAIFGHGSPFHQPTRNLQRLLLDLLIVGPEKARHYALKRCATQPESCAKGMDGGPKETLERPADPKKRQAIYNGPQK